jgi:CCR4-NOT transcription complex subunit 1
MNELELAVSARSEEELKTMVEGLTALVGHSVSPNEVALAFAQKVFKRLYEKADTPSLTSLYILILVHIRDVCKSVVKELTNWILYSEDEKKFHKKITIRLLNAQLLKAADFDVHLAKRIDNGRNKAALDFAVYLIQKCLLRSPPTLAHTELAVTLDTLDKIAHRNAGPEGYAVFPFLLFFVCLISLSHLQPWGTGCCSQSGSIANNCIEVSISFRCFVSLLY